MVKVRARQVCFIDNHLRKEGEEFDYDGPPSPRVIEFLEDEQPTKRPCKGASTAARKPEVDAARAESDSA